MKRHLNTLFVMTDGASLFKDNLTIGVRIEKKVKLRVPIHTIGSIVCFGKVYCSPQALGFCVSNGVSVSFLSPHGKFLARVVGPVTGNVLLRKAQYRISESTLKSARLAKYFVIGKLFNSRAVLSRAIRDHSGKIDVDRVKAAMEEMNEIIRRIEKEEDLEKIRGFEGEAARLYFNVFNELITSQKDHFVFMVRNRRPPLDRVNSMLSFIYTIMLNDIRSALETVGLDPQVGFLHRDRPGRLGLALDMLEEFRSFFADRLVLSLINLKKINQNCFRRLENGAIYIVEEARKMILTSYQQRKQATILHPFLKEKTTFGLLFFVQALLLARYIRGDIDGYPPFLWK